MAKTKPQKEQETTLKSWEEVDSSLKAIAVITAKEMALEAEMNGKLQKVEQEYLPKVDRLKAEKIGLERDIQLYCEAKKDMFDESRSYSLNYGKVGFRLGTGALKTLKGITWEAAKALINSSRKWRERFIRVKEEIDKNAIQTSGMTKEQLAKIGMYVHQEDTFYYEAFLKRSNELPQEAEK